MAIRKNIYVDFSTEPPLGLFNTATGITALAATTTVNGFRTSRGHWFEIYNDGQNDQLVLTGGAVGATGWVPPLDNAADAIEITCGNSATYGRPTFTVGTDPAFFVRVGGKIGTIARSTALVAGFRQQGSYVTTKGADTTALATAYNRKAMVGNATVAGVLKTFTSIASGTDVVTSLAGTALVDSQFFSLEVNVSAAGAVTYRIGQSASSLSAAESALAADASAVACTIDSGTVLIPSIVMLGTAATGINDSGILKFQCGLA
jgi:hypothetical protein